jgi:hypothetical protein
MLLNFLFDMKVLFAQAIILGNILLAIVLHNTKLTTAAITF